MTKAKAYAAHSADDSLKPWEFERRALKPYDVQYDILYCGVCHSDVHQVRNEWGNAKYPMVPGHEIVGRVVAIGDKVTKFKIGDMVGTGCLVDSCRTCDNCAQGLEQFCHNGNSGTYNSFEQDKKTPTYGGYSSSIVVHEDFTLRISDSLDPAAVAPLLCAGITTYSPLRHWKVGKGHRLAILGLGGLGHMGVKFGKAFGAEVTVLSSSASKEADAKKLGADHFVLTKNADEVAKYKGYFDFILDTVSADHDLVFYTTMLRANGVHIFVGIPPTPFQLPAYGLIGGRKSVAGSLIGGLPETQEMLDFCAQHNIVSDIELIDIKDIETAFERMMKGDVRYRFVIDMATL